MHSLAAVTHVRGFDRSHILTGFPTTLHLLRCGSGGGQPPAQIPDDGVLPLGCQTRSARRDPSGPGEVDAPRGDARRNASGAVRGCQTRSRSVDPAAAGALSPRRAAHILRDWLDQIKPFSKGCSVLNRGSRGPAGDSVATIRSVPRRGCPRPLRGSLHPVAPPVEAGFARMLMISTRCWRDRPGDPVARFGPSPSALSPTACAS
jgi:hypothetical protein